MKNTQHSNGRDGQASARAEKWAEVLTQFHRSGQTRRAFAEQQGIALATLSYWLTREKRKALNGASSAPMVFRELNLSPQSSQAESGWAVEIVSSTGLTVRSRKALPAGALIRLMRARGC